MDLNPQMSSAEHGNAVVLDHAVVISPTARQGIRRSIEMTEEAKAGGNAPDMPTSVWSDLARTDGEPD